MNPQRPDPGRRRGSLPLVFAAAAVLLAACATPASRIADEQSTFDSYPADVQQKIKAGEVSVGFSKDMVRLALGKPDREYQRETGEGRSEIWAYFDSKPSFNIGLGLGGFGGRTSVGGGVGIGLGGNEEEKLRIVFQNERVSVIERNAAP